MAHLVGFFVLGLVFLMLERLHSARQQAVQRPGWRTDAFHVLLSNAAPSAAFQAGAYALLAHWDHLLPHLGLMNRAPLWLELAILFLLTELSFYAVHRAMHHVSWLWRIHSIHHSIDQMDWLSGYRKHALETVIHTAVPFAPVAMLGFSTTAWTVYAVAGLFFTGFTHLNVAWGPSWLDAIVVTPAYHSWHHAVAPAAQRTNFAGKLSVLDRAFGTRQPAHEPYRGPHGLDAQEAVPATWWRQQLHGLSGRAS